MRSAISRMRRGSKPRSISASSPLMASLSPRPRRSQMLEASPRPMRPASVWIKMTAFSEAWCVPRLLWKGCGLGTRTGMASTWVIFMGLGEAIDAEGGIAVGPLLIEYEETTLLGHVQVDLVLHEQQARVVKERGFPEGFD